MYDTYVYTYIHSRLVWLFNNHLRRFPEYSFDLIYFTYINSTFAFILASVNHSDKLIAIQLIKLIIISEKLFRFDRIQSLFTRARSNISVLIANRLRTSEPFHTPNSLRKSEYLSNFCFF